MVIVKTYFGNDFYIGEKWLKRFDNLVQYYFRNLVSCKNIRLLYLKENVYQIMQNGNVQK